MREGGGEGCSYYRTAGGKGAGIFDMVGGELLGPRVEGRDEGLGEADFCHGSGGARDARQGWRKCGIESVKGRAVSETGC